MANLNPVESFETLKTRVLESIREQFPVIGKKHRIELVSLSINDTLSVDDVKSQLEKKLQKGTWAVPVQGTLRLVEISTNKTLDEATLTLASVPKITRRYSYIVDGHERQHDSLFRLKPGVFHRIADNGEIEARWSMQQGVGFSLHVDRNNGYLSMAIGTSTVPLYTVLHALGVADATLQKAWGEAFQVNQQRGRSSEILKIPKTLARTAENKKAAEKMTEAEASAYVQELFSRSKTRRPDGSYHSTLSTSFENVTPQALLESGQRLLAISRGTAKEDDRQSLSSKDVYGTEDYVSDFLRKAKPELARKIRNRLDKSSSVREIVTSNFFTKTISSTFEKGQLPEQFNPLTFLSGHLRTTLVGGDFGGVKGDHTNLDDDKLINPTHLGFLDPIQTPESEVTGITLHLPVGVKRKGNDLYIRVWDVHKNDYVEVTPGMMERKTVAYPDQVKWVNGKPKPIKDVVVVYDKDRNTSQRPWKEVDYVLLSSKSLFSFSANLIPFLPTCSGNRAMMAAKQQEQAVSLTYREAPLVQSKTDGAATFDHLVGGFAAHSAPVDGKVLKITKDAVVIQPTSGKPVEVALYDHFPLNGGKTMLTSIPKVKVGDAVKKGALLADTNFTDNGVFALGTNLRVAYTPYHGRTFEDSIVISESAAKKLTSSHLHREEVHFFPGMELNFRLWKQYTTPDRVAKAAKLDGEGVIKEGEKVLPGDVLAAVVSKRMPRPEESILGVIHKRTLDRPYEDRHTLVWDHDYPGTVTRVVKGGKTLQVFVRTDEPATIGDKLTGRHGNKGIIGTILPDHEMPHDKDGGHVEVLLGPAGVPSRMNVSQLLETAASKIARKTGKPYVVENFVPGVDYTQKVKDELKQHKLSDTEELFDASTKKSIGHVLTGEQHVLKLHHQVDKKITARSYGGGYDHDGAPTQGSGIPGGGQTMDQLATYALLAHGANVNLREMRTYKSDDEQWEVWEAIQRGNPLPDPKPGPGMQKLTGYLRGLGVHMERKGDKYVLSPLTDHQTKKLSNGEIDFPAKTLTAKDIRTIEDAGGLFDPKKTGGLTGRYWTHIELQERLPNPVFETPICSLLGITEKEFEHFVSPDAHNVKGTHGFDELSRRLKGVDVKAEIKKTETSLPKLSGTELDKAYKKLRYLRALDQNNLTAFDAYTTKLLPVIPPSMRPVMPNPDGSMTLDSLNHLYRAIGQINHQIKVADRATPPSELQKYRSGLYDAVRALKMTGTDLGGKDKTRHQNGIMETLSGNTPKQSFFQNRLMYRRQDLSARSTIIVAPELALDEVGIPLPIAMEVYKPFVVNELRSRRGMDPNTARKMVEKKDNVAVDALHRVVADRPIMLKRDPALHKFSIMAFTPRITSGKAIGLHPLVCSGFNADFDGDAMSAFVPISQKAVDEAKGMMPSKNIFSPTTGKALPVPPQDALLGLFKLTNWGQKLSGKLAPKTAAEAIKLVQQHKLAPDAVFTLDGRETTGGRLLLAADLPLDMQKHEKLLHDSNYRVTKGAMSEIAEVVGKKHPQDYARVVDAWKNHGNKFAYLLGSSFSLNDFHDGKQMREQILAPYRKQEEQIRKNTSLSQKEKDQKIVDLYSGAIGEMEEKGIAAYAKSGNKVYEWVHSGARGNWDQFRQMVLGPILVQDARNKPVPIPITHSFGEGLTASEYWTSLHGARKGTIDRAAGTAEPGALTKVIINTVLDHQVMMPDCHTTEGAHLPPTDADVPGRYLAQPVTAGTHTYTAGTLLSANELSVLRAANVPRVVVRSPLYCKAPKGLCAMCFGHNEEGKLHVVGKNIGVIAGHALGEPVTQMAMQTFHTGGAVKATKSGYQPDAFERVQQLFKVPKKLRGEATIAMVSGTISKIEPNKAAGGYDLYIGKTKHRVPGDVDLLPIAKVGAEVLAGTKLSEGNINPHALLKATNDIHQVRQYITNEALGSYPKGTKRRNVETVVRAMTDVAQVDDPGDHPIWLRGQTVPLSEAEHFNEEAKKHQRRPVQFHHILKSMEQVPLTHSEDFMARMNYREIKNTLEAGAAQAWSSDIHQSTIAGLAHGAEFGMKQKTVSSPLTSKPADAHRPAHK